MASSTYRVVLRTAAVRSEAIAGLFAQVTQGAAGVGLILVVRGHTGSLALAGAVVGALAIAAGIARPLQGRLIDRRGTAALMSICGVVHAAALVGIVILADVHGPGALMIALGVVGGGALPPVSTSMRVVWGAAFPAEERTAAYSLVYLTQELSILVGPLVLSGLLAVSDASLAMIAVAALAGAGTLSFAAMVGERGRELMVGDRGGELGPRNAGGLGTVFREPGMRALVAVAFLTGGLVGALEVGAPTIAAAHHAPTASGLLIAAVAVGGIIGALIYGGRRWSSAPSRRLLLLFGALTITMTAMVAVGNLVLLGTLMLLCGLALNPALTTTSVLADDHVSRAAAAEAFGWLSSGISGGTGAASAITGALTSTSHPQTAFVIAAIIAAMGTALSAAAQRTLAAGCGKSAERDLTRALYASEQ
jgi:MFS family permease